jgi:hypothetical protein
MLLKTVYYRCPELQQKHGIVKLKTTSVDTDEEPTGSDSINQVQGQLSHTLMLPRQRHTFGWISNAYQNILQLDYIQGWRVYARQEMLLAALSLAMLYFTVLRFEWKTTSS